MVIAIVGNKSDLDHGDWKVSDKEVQELAKKCFNSVITRKCSAKTGEGV